MIERKQERRNLLTPGDRRSKQEPEALDFTEPLEWPDEIPAKAGMESGSE